MSAILEKLYQRDKEVVIGTFNFNGNGKSLVYGETDGFIEVIRDKKTDDLLGVSMIGPHVTDLIAEASTAMYLDAAPIEIGEAIHAHPTMTSIASDLRYLWLSDSQIEKG